MKEITPPLSLREDKVSLQKILNTKWRLKSIFESGIISDEAKFKNVDIVFSPFHIYAIYGNRIDQFKYKFITEKSFIVEIEGQTVKCIIKELDNNNFVFHADFNNHYFILELENQQN
jgi:hypothetical protein